MMRLSRPPPLKNLRAFCAAARHRSFKFAADELCVTPSAVSHQMKELETALGTRLFERKTRALELTTAAHHLLDEVEPLLDALLTKTRALRLGGGRESGTEMGPLITAAHRQRVLRRVSAGGCRDS